MTKEELKEYLKRDDLKIEGNTVRWDINAAGNVLGKYTGTFTFKCFLTPTEKLAVGRLYRQLLGNNAVLALEHEDNMAFTMSQLAYRVVSGPPFWKSSVGVDGIAGDIPDTNVLDIILEGALAAEFKYLALIEQKKEKVLQRAKKTAEAISEDKQEDKDEPKEED